MLCNGSRSVLIVLRWQFESTFSDFSATWSGALNPPRFVMNATGVYSMTALGKDPRNGDLSVAEIMIATVREGPPNSVRIKWDKLEQHGGGFTSLLTVPPGAS
ncbi:hypothetical protein T01_7096 [Trichinella spiralis]|uniref:Uncharacterized protein n=1 Tax=Trichinella spiralis TaxID=6334 RepID=A0A0V1ARR7_TRISP|nr:hypothetical protein T01_7096 [Trichinella spiralis]